MFFLCCRNNKELISSVSSRHYERENNVIRDISLLSSIETNIDADNGDMRNSYNELCSSNSKFSTATYKNTPKFLPNIRIGKVIKVYDGDTITVAAQPYEKSILYRFTIRLFGIDTPEIRTKDVNEKKAAKYVRDFLSQLILNKIVMIRVMGKDKYGRLLAKVYERDANTDISTLLLIKRYCLPYDGGRKYSPENWLDIVKI